MRRELTAEPQQPPYLLSPPSSINIDVGRQLFVDDFLIEESSLFRQFHPATYHAGNPVLSPEREWERQDPNSKLIGYPPNHSAMPFSDGVFYDPADRVFKMWYMAGYQYRTALAVSTDGIAWDRPSFGIVPGTNIVSTLPRDSTTVWLDLDAPRSARFKMAAYHMKSGRSEEHTSELQSQSNLVCRLLLEKKNKKKKQKKIQKITHTKKTLTK